MIIAFTIIFLILGGVAFWLTVIAFGDKSKKTDSSSTKKESQWKVPECPPQLIGWSVIIAVVLGCVYGVMNLSSNVFAEGKATSKLVKTTQVHLKAFETQVVPLDSHLEHFRYTIPETKETLVRFIDRYGELIWFRCNGQLVKECLSTGSNKVITDFQTYPRGIVFESASVQNGIYSFEVKEY